MSSSTSEETVSIPLDHLINHSRFDYRMSDTLNSKILHIWSSPKTCDLLFLVSHRHYYAHSCILLTVCHSLRNHLTSNNNKSSMIKYTCQLKFTSYQGLELLLIYIYTSRLILNISTISDLLLAAGELNVEYVIQRSIQFINKSIENMYNEPSEYNSSSYQYFGRMWHVVY
ncbi:unnamed protein product [Adineta steineri]|uniref:BTB domain-containing protein n=1 Tax=Adineta steineri TaxID=433720 RepID=A0A820LL58_9BILA|nr:unnamed protein product [Adineta steineri]CAF4359126.1 unnamed protein product [Adineta steineri]